MDLKEIKRIAYNAINQGSSYEKDRDITCWNMYNSNVDNKDLSYLNSFGDYKLPAKIPFNSITKDTIDWIVSRYLSRPFVFSVKAIDQKSVKRKYQKRLEAYFKTIDDRIENKLSQLSLQMTKINEEKSMMQQVLQQQPENEEQAKKLQELQQKMPEINAQIDRALKVLSREVKLTEEDKEKVDTFYKYNYKDVAEIQGKKTLLHLKDKLGIEGENEKNFLEFNVTGDPFYFVDYNEKNKKYIYKNIPGHTVDILGPSDTEFTDQCSVVVINEEKNLNQVIKEYGDQLSDQDKMSIRKGYYIGDNAFSYYDKQNQVYGFHSGTNRSDNTMINVKRVFIMVNEGLDFVESRSKNNPNNVHYKVRKETDNIRKNQNILKRYKNNTYEAVVIENQLVTNVKRRGEQDAAIRKYDDPGYSELPLIGFNFNQIDNAKNSLIWVTKDLQRLHSIVSHYEEYIIAVSGVKSLLLDKGQMPDMDVKEWQQEKKLGAIWIETVKKSMGFQGRKSNFNQWNVLDLGLDANAIMALEQVKNNLSQTISRIGGVSRQAKGDISQYDGKNTSQYAIEASSLITDIKYWKHDRLTRKALLRLLRLYSNIDGKKDQYISFLDEEGVLENDFVPKDVLRKVDLDLIVTNNNEEMRKMEKISDMIMGAVQQGNMQINDASKALSSKTINEMEAKLDYFVEKSIEVRQRSMQADRQSEQQKEQMKAEIDKYLADQKNKIEEYKVQMDKYKTDMDAKLKQAELSIQEDKNNADTRTKILDILTERETEVDYLEEQKRSSVVDETLKFIDAKLNEEAIKKDERKQDKKNISDEKRERTKASAAKANADNRTSAKPRAKEHIKD